MLVQLVHIEIKPGTEAEFLRAFRINHEGTVKEPDNRRFDVLKNQGEENRYTIYEVFASEEDFQYHRNTPHYHECVKILEPIMIGKREKTYFDPLIADYLR